MPFPIVDLCGVEPPHVAILARAGIRSAEELLEHCRTPHSRRMTATKTSIAEDQLFAWANLADVARIRGIARQYLQLLTAAGVHSMKDLRYARADDLSQRLRRANAENELCKVTPSVAVVRKWIDQAKTLGSKVTSK